MQTLTPSTEHTIYTIAAQMQAEQGTTVYNDEDRVRINRALDLVAYVERHPTLPGVFEVKSASNPNWTYTVGNTCCSCPDAARRDARRCKHAYAVQIFQRLERAETDAEQPLVMGGSDDIDADRSRPAEVGQCSRCLRIISADEAVSRQDARGLTFWRCTACDGCDQHYPADQLTQPGGDGSAVHCPACADGPDPFDDPDSNESRDDDSGDDEPRCSLHGDDECDWGCPRPSSVEVEPPIVLNEYDGEPWSSPLVMGGSDDLDAEAPIGLELTGAAYLALMPATGLPRALCTGCGIEDATSRHRDGLGIDCIRRELYGEV